MIVSMNEDEWRLFTAEIQPLFIGRIRRIPDTNRHTVEVSEVDADRIAQQLMHLVAEQGFDSEYRATGKGVTLETMIDKFNPAS